MMKIEKADKSSFAGTDADSDSTVQDKHVSPAIAKPNVMRSLCSECHTNNIHCKNLCKECYRKMYRNTEKAKEYITRYNSTAGKEANKRFREKIRKNKPPKPKKIKCECGKISVAKGLCMTCYQRKRNGWKGSIYEHKYNTEDIFNKVLVGVKNGLTISRACNEANVNRSTLYKIISSIQKKELITCKAIGYYDNDVSEDYA